MAPTQIDVFNIVSRIVERAEVAPTQNLVTRPEGPNGTIHHGWLVILRYWAETPPEFDWAPLAEELHNAVTAADPDGGPVEVWIALFKPGYGLDCIYPDSAGGSTEDWMCRRRALGIHLNPLR